MKRLHALLQTLGPAGVAAIGVLLFCVAFHAGALRTVERELSALRATAARDTSPAALRAPADGTRGADLQRFYHLFPPLQELPGEIERLHGMARAAGVELLRADYRLEDREAPLAAYRVTLPLRAPYPRIRDFAGSVLQSMPSAAIDALRLERRKADETELNAQLSLTLYFRTAEEVASR